jgi:hypothetical protein
MKKIFIFLIFALCIYGAKAQNTVYGVSNTGYVSLQQYPAILSISDINFVTDNGDKILKGTERGTFTFKINNSATVHLHHIIGHNDFQVTIARKFT